MPFWPLIYVCKLSATIQSRSTFVTYDLTVSESTICISIDISGKFSISSFSRFLMNSNPLSPNSIANFWRTSRTSDTLVWWLEISLSFAWLSVRSGIRMIVPSRGFETLPCGFGWLDLQNSPQSHRRPHHQTTPDEGLGLTNVHAR